MTTVTTTLAPGRQGTETAHHRPVGVIRHSLVLARRGLIRIRRTPEGLADATIAPVFFLVMCYYLLGGGRRLPARLLQQVFQAAMAVCDQRRDAFLFPFPFPAHEAGQRHPQVPPARSRGQRQQPVPAQHGQMRLPQLPARIGAKFHSQQLAELLDRQRFSAPEPLLRFGQAEPVPVVPLGPRGSEASVRGIASTLGQSPGIGAVLLANHGLLAFGGAAGTRHAELPGVTGMDQTGLVCASSSSHLALADRV
ncbi:MAG: hypothetical protein ACLP8X_37300 [Streptosporangiaceae bacterium]